MCNFYKENYKKKKIPKQKKITNYIYNLYINYIENLVEIFHVYIYLYIYRERGKMFN